MEFPCCCSLTQFLIKRYITALLYLTHPAGRIFFSELLGWRKKVILKILVIDNISV